MRRIAIVWEILAEISEGRPPWVFTLIEKPCYLGLELKQKQNLVNCDNYTRVLIALVSCKHSEFSILYFELSLTFHMNIIII